MVAFSTKLLLKHRRGEVSSTRLSGIGMGDVIAMHYVGGCLSHTYEYRIPSMHVWYNAGRAQPQLGYGGDDTTAHIHHANLVEQHEAEKKRACKTIHAHAIEPLLYAETLLHTPILDRVQDRLEAPTELAPSEPLTSTELLTSIELLAPTHFEAPSPLRSKVLEDPFGLIVHHKRARKQVVSYLQYAASEPNTEPVELTWDEVFEETRTMIGQKKFASIKRALDFIHNLVRTRVGTSKVLAKKGLRENGLFLVDRVVPGDIITALTTNVHAKSVPPVGEMSFKFRERGGCVYYASWDLHCNNTSGGAANTKLTLEDPDINSVFRVVHVKVCENGRVVRRKIAVLVATSVIEKMEEACVEYGDEFVQI